MSNSVTDVPFAPAAAAEAHYAAKLTFETDCADVHEAMRAGATDFVLLDVRGPARYTDGHAPGALHLPYRKIDERKLADWAADTQFVVYCDGPHCNGADRGALRLARLGRKVKIMIGGMSGWILDGFEVARGSEPGKP